MWSILRVSSPSTPLLLLRRFFRSEVFYRIRLIPYLFRRRR